MTRSDIETALKVTTEAIRYQGKLRREIMSLTATGENPDLLKAKQEEMRQMNSSYYSDLAKKFPQS